MRPVTRSKAIAPSTFEATVVATRRDMSPVVATEVSEQLIAYIAERTEPTESAAGIAIDELFADYRAWRKEGRGMSLRLEEKDLACSTIACTISSACTMCAFVPISNTPLILRIFIGAAGGN